MNEDSNIVQLTVAVPCSFCAGHYYGATCDGEGSVIHSTPICDTFDDLEPVDFLEAARLRREGVEH